MSIVEKVLIMSAVLMPFIALVVFLPGVIKNRKIKKANSKPEPEPQPIKEPEPEPQPQPVAPTPHKVDSHGHENDFLEYAENKRKRVSAPKRNNPIPNFKDFEGFSKSRPSIRQQPVEEKTIQEEINSLSPSLKALIITGALNKRDFDE